jgi:hypothetical protein
VTRWILLVVGLSWACSSSSSSVTPTTSASGAGGSASTADAATDDASGSGGSAGQGADSDATSADPTDAGSGERQVCAMFANTLCAKLESCSPFVLAVLYGEIATCRDRATLGCLPAFDAPGTSATPAKTAACERAMAGLACPSFLAGDFGSACKVDPGTVAVDGVCTDDGQCATTFCARAPDAACGVCQPPTTAGAPCLRSSCSAGTVCPAGQSTCITPVAGNVNDSCTAQEQCDLAHAVGCNTSSGKCLSLTLASARGSCGANSIFPTSYAVCPASGTCSAALGGTCSVAAKDGESCSTADTGTHCMLPARCVGGTCALSDPKRCL